MLFFGAIIENVCGRHVLSISLILVYKSAKQTEVTDNMLVFFEKISAFFGAVMPPLLIAAGLGFGVMLRFFYLCHPIKTCRLMFARSGDGISPMRAASMALAGTLGVGNITGVTAAIAVGGAGAVFWMWVSAFVAMSVKYAETVLAVKYREHDGAGYCGGAPFYIAKGAKSRTLGAVFAVFCIINSIVVGNILQVNAAASSASDSFAVPRVATGIIIAALTATVVIGGAKRISSVTSALIPIVSIIYILMCVAVTAKYAELLPTVTGRIFREAFSMPSAAGGVGGYGIAAAVRYGVTRGILTNEAGSGTSPTAHACADAASPMAQGCLGIFEVFADTIIICSMTAFAMLIGEEIGIAASTDAMTSASAVFSFVLGDGARTVLSFVIVVFVLATLISQHYYGEVALRFLGGRRFGLIYTAAFIAAAVCGSVIAPQLMWELSDITVGLLTTVNVVCLCVMHRQVSECTDTDFRHT